MDERVNRRSELGPAVLAVDPSPVAGLQISFLDHLPLAQQVRIYDLSVRASRPLQHWANKYPLIRRERVWPLALSVAAAAPFASVEALIATARLNLWVFTLDDLFDEERVPLAELLRRAERYRAIAHRRAADAADDSLAMALRDVCDDFARYPLFQTLGDGWAEALGGTIDGMLCEYRWRDAFRDQTTEALPSYAEYVANGLYSIGGLLHVWATLITIDDPSTPHHLEHLLLMGRLACTCIRLANDLQSSHKELAEGKINALVLLSQGFLREGMPLDEAYAQARRRVQADITAALRQLAILQAVAQTDTGEPEAALADIARFVCDFYVEHDYHTVSALFAPRRPTPRRAP